MFRRKNKTSLLINPIRAEPEGDEVNISPEGMILYNEGSVEFDYIAGLIGEWDSFVSPAVTIPDAVAKVLLQANNIGLEAISRCTAYIYGYNPKNAEWNPGSCSAIVCFESPTITTSPVNSVTININIEYFQFNESRTVPVDLSSGV